MRPAHQPGGDAPTSADERPAADEGAVEIALEFARGESTGDPHAFRFAPQTYIVRTPRGGFGASELPWDADLLAKLADVRRAGQDPALLAEVGELLRRFLAPAGWELHERQLSAAIQRRRPVHITIRSAAAELYALPWELLTLRASGQCLGGLPGVLVRYEWPETESAARRDTPSAPGRILVAWSAAGGMVPAAEHFAAIRAAAAAGGFAFESTDVLAHASPGRIADELERAERDGRPIAALHILCHGGARGSLFGLALDPEAPEDPPVILDPARLQQLIAPHAANLRLVVLAACDSGNQGDFGAQIGSTAQMLHRAGLAAVVASRYPLSTPGSERLTATLYRGLLAERASLERAFVATRTALAGDATRLDWASVQLYARAADGAATFPIRPRAASSDPASAPRSTHRTKIAAGVGVVVALLGVAWFGAALHGAPPPPTDLPAPPLPTELPAPPLPTPPLPLPPVVSAPTKDAPPDPEKKPSATRPDKEERPKDKLRAPPPIPPRKPVECTPRVKSYIRSVLPGEGTRLVTIAVAADADGSVRATNLDGPDEAAATRQFKKAHADKVRELAGGELPCYYDYPWLRPEGSEAI